MTLPSGEGYGTKKKSKTDIIYQIKITLKDVKPPIWRRIHVESDVLLPEFHLMIQAAMGWTNSHLHQFRQGEISYSLPNEDSFFQDEGIDYQNIMLQELLQKEKDKLISLLSGLIIKYPQKDMVQALQPLAEAGV